jgi:hypothetical protein
MKEEGQGECVEIICTTEEIWPDISKDNEALLDST